jgi:6-phosphogluconolactonase
MELSQQQIRWQPIADSTALQEVVAARILAAAGDALDARGRFVVVLAGGNTPRGVYEKLRGADTDWSSWHVYFGDERCMPVADAERNSRMAGQAWLDHVAIPPGQVHPMPAELGPAEAARLYERTLSAVGDFDLVLLGLGEDGHVGSLFPGRPPGSLADSPDVLAVLDAPKPPPSRVSLSAARFSRARAVFFMVAGEEKRAAVARWRRGEAIPAAAIRPGAGVDVFIEAGLLER